MPGVVCVLSFLAHLRGAYLMTYFSRPPLPPAEGTQQWLRSAFYYDAGNGDESFVIRNDIWDFDLAPWFEQDSPKIYWIDPRDETMTLRSGPAAQCPYVDLPGLREPRMLTSAGITPGPLPDGSEASGLF